MLGVDSASHRDLAIPPGGIDERHIVEHVRAIAAKLRKQSCHATWMVVANNEVVGLCGFHSPPSAEGNVEIGYNTAPNRRGLGHATAAVRAMLILAENDPAIHTITAETTIENIASQRVLERNGFVRTGQRLDPEDGELITWRAELQPLR
jgi:RimJ/RimL family protein N-acetyltransferase